MTEKEFSEEDLERFERAAAAFENRRRPDEWQEVEGPAIPSTHSKLVSIRLPQDLYAALVDEAQNRNESFSDIVRTYLRNQVGLSADSLILNRLDQVGAQILDRLDWLEKRVAEIPAQPIFVQTLVHPSGEERFRRFGTLQSESHRYAGAAFRLMKSHTTVETVSGEGQR